MKSTLDETLGQLAEVYAEGVSELSEHVVLSGGLVQAALNEVIWALYRAFPGDDESIVEHLDIMGDIVRSQAKEDSTRRADVPADT